MANWQVGRRAKEKTQQLDMVSGTLMGVTWGSVTSDKIHQNAAQFCEQHGTQIKASAAQRCCRSEWR